MRIPVRATASWALVGGAILIAGLLRVPLLYRIRYSGLALIVLAAAVVCFKAARARQLKLCRPGEQARALLLLVAALIGLGREASFWLTRRAVLEAEPDRLRRVGRHLIAGYTDFAEIRTLAVAGAIGGVFVTTRNLHRHSVERLRGEIQELQRLRRVHRLPLLLVATDQEGGWVSRLSPPLTGLPPLSELVEGAASQDERRQAIEAYAETQARELSSVGININFGPIADLRQEHRGARVDLHSQIH